MHKILTKPPSKILAIILKTLLSLYLSLPSNAIVHIPNFDLKSTPLDPPTTGFSMKVDGTTNYLGYSLSTAGDINNDGYKDIIVGAYARDGLKGAAYVIYGHPNFPSSFADLDLTTLDPARTGFIISGNAASDELCYSVSAGKINDDDYGDIIIGAPTKSFNKGMVYVIYGGPSSSRAHIDLATTTLDPLTTGFSITGNGSGNHFGLSVSTAGDVNGDGYDDIIIGAPTKTSNKGTVYVVYGGPSSQMTNIDLGTTALNPASTGFYVVGQNANDWFGFSVATAGNLDNDEYDDIIIGAPNRMGLRGVAYVIFGKEKSLFTNINLAIDSFSATNRGFSIIGSDPSGQFGRSVSTAGDTDRDGFDDVIIGAGSAFITKGAAYVIYGRETMSNLDLSSTALDPATTGFTIIGEIAPDYFGISVGSAGDVNGDGYQDVMIGAYQNSNGRGAAYVVYGGPKDSRSDINLGVTSLDFKTTGFKVTGNTDGDLLGVSVNGAGDVNGDGFDDIVIGAHARNNYQGAAYLIHSSCVGSGQCQERNFCESCDGGYSLTNSKCKICPKNCQEFSGLTTICKVCDKGYFLSNSLCVKRSEESLSKAAQALSDTVSSLGGALSIGSSLFPVTKLVSKIVQNTRYLDLIVTEELTEVYQNWNTNLINVDLPDAFSSLEGSKPLPETFARYDLDSVFLANFWSNLLILGAIFGTFIISRTLKRLLNPKRSRGGWGYSLLERIVAGSLNLTLVQGYGCLDDVIFYFALDVETNRFKGGFSWASFLIGLVFLGLGVWLILFNILIVKRYQQAKSNKINLEHFLKNNKHWELFYGDFSDIDSWAHSFLAILAIRNCISSFIITVLYSSPLMQTALLVVIDGTIIIFLMAKTPLKELRARWTQYFYQITALLVHICTFILAMQGDQVSPLKIGKIIFCKARIYLNYGLIVGGVVLMFIEIYKTLSPKIKTWQLQRKQRAEEKTVKKIASEDSAIKPLDSSFATLCLPTDKGHRQKKINIKRGRTPQDHIEAGLNFEEQQQSSLNLRGRIFLNQK